MVRNWRQREYSNISFCQKKSLFSKTWDENTKAKIFSGSKWLFGAYLAEVRKGNLTQEDVELVTFKSGYVNMMRCIRRNNGLTFVETG